MKYTTERQGQEEFYKSFLPRVNGTLSLDDVLSDNTDGVVNGSIIEFKLIINDVNATLFQAIKYLSSMRVKGKSVPYYIVLVSLNANKAYVYKSEDYISEIEKIYTLRASKDNSGFKSHDPYLSLDLSFPIDRSQLISILKTIKHTKINIDENCIVGWAQRFYRENPSARKSDFIGGDDGFIYTIGEIRSPDKFKSLINPYKGNDNLKFRYLMDKLNDNFQQKDLGAFYTPHQYAEKTIELVRKAIDRVPEGNDYVIIDRCAGTGNLEQYLTEEELSHVIVSTLEYFEYKVLMEVLGDKVRHVIPPNEDKDTFNMGLVRGADALSEEYVKNEIIMQYIDDVNCTVILLENPPYAETTSLEHQKQNKGKSSSSWKKSFVVQEMKKDKNIKGNASGDMGNAFIWSAFKYYLRQPSDSYIVFSPVKYWKVQHLISKKFIEGYAFNRRHFHTNIDACIMVALWSNEYSNNDELQLLAYNIDKKNKLNMEKNISIRKIYSRFSEKYYDKRTFVDDSIDGICCEFNGTESSKASEKVRVTKKFNENIVGYLTVDTSGFDNPDAHSGLTSAGRYDGNGFFLRKDNFLEKLPMFAASRYVKYNREWTERSRIMKSADGSSRFYADISSGKLSNYLLKVLLFTTLEMQNHMRSFTGSDGRQYTNQLCLDNSCGDTLATKYLKSLKMNSAEISLLNAFESVLTEAKKSIYFNPCINYGVYQIYDELNTYQKDQTSGKKVYDNPMLNGNLNTLKSLLKNYYNEEIVPTLLDYQLLK